MDRIYAGEKAGFGKIESVCVCHILIITGFIAMTAFTSNDFIATRSNEQNQQREGKKNQQQRR